MRSYYLYKELCQGRNNLFLALFIMIIILNTSCRPMKEITIDVLRPAKVTLPGEIERISFANRSYQPYLSRSARDTALRSPRDLYVIDTIFQSMHFNGLFDALGNELVYDVDDRLILVKRRSDSTRFPDPLTLKQIHQITDTSITDALFSLDGYVLRDSVFYWYSYKTYQYEVFFMITGKVLWRIYDVHSGSVLDEHYVIDTLEWGAAGPSVSLAALDLPAVTDNYRKFSYQSGKKYGLRLTPDWYDEKRYFYTGSWDMGYATRQVTEDDWEEALKVWKELSGLKRKRISAKAAFNTALYYEMEDRLVPALDWAKKSKELHDFDLTGEYIKLLEKRIKDRLRLQQQIPPE